MFCRYCGKELPDDSNFCPNCGKGQKESIREFEKEEPTTIGVVGQGNVENMDIKQDVINNKCQVKEPQVGKDIEDFPKIDNENLKMPLYRRFIGTIVDKIILIVIFAVVSIVISPYGAAGRLGTYIGLRNISPNHYEYIDKAAISRYVSYTDGLSKYHQDMEQLTNEPPYIGSTLELDLNITLAFILLNLIYYVLFESIISASPGKRMLGGLLLDSKGNKIGFKKACMRGLLGCIFMVGTYYIFHLQIGLCNTIVVVLFFSILDVSVFLKKRSLLDIVSRTVLVSRQTTIVHIPTKKEMSIERLKFQNIDYSPKFFFKNNTNVLIWVFFVILSLYPVHKILSYYFADYYNLSNYKSNNIYDDRKSDNYKRKNGHFNYHPLEKYASVDKGVLKPQSIENVSNQKQLIEGKYISTYEYSGEDGYHYTYNTISTFDISDSLSFFIYDDIEYSRYLERVENKIKKDNIKIERTSINGQKALVYYPAYNIKRSIVCTNQRVYLIETKAEHDIEKVFSQYCSRISFSYNPTGRNLVLLFLFIVFMCSLMFVMLIKDVMKAEILNRYSYSLFVICIFSFIVNIGIALYQAYALFTDYISTNSSVVEIAGALLTVICIVTPLCIFYFRKSRTKWGKEYIVPSFLKKNHYNRIENNTMKKAYVIFVCYPLMVLSLLPLGIFIILFYSIPILMVICGIILFKKWNLWAKGSRT